jgi:four helix bundle protein
MESAKIREFTDLKTWQEGHKLVVLIYNATKNFPKDELYSIVNQMRRAVASHTANIAEGFGRHFYKEKIQYYYQAQGSLTEVKNFLIIARDVKYLTESEFNVLMNQAQTTHKLLQGLITKTKTFISSKS